MSTRHCLKWRHRSGYTQFARAAEALRWEEPEYDAAGEEEITAQIADGQLLRHEAQRDD